MWFPHLGWQDSLRKKWYPTPVFLPGKSKDRRAWWVTYSPWGHLKARYNSETIQKHFFSEL